MVDPQFDLAAMVEAIDTGDAERIRRLLQEHPEQRTAYTPFAGGTWLHYAALESTLEVVRLLVEAGFDVNQGDRWQGANSLSRAALAGRLDIAEYLLEQGAALDVGSPTRNALFGAIVGRSPEIAKLLLDRGIDSRVRYDSDTMTNMDAVAFAMMRGEREIAHLIARWNAHGDEAAAQAAVAEGLRIARENTKATDAG